jgi:hypothetical protein
MHRVAGKIGTISGRLLKLAANQDYSRAQPLERKLALAI